MVNPTWRHGTNSIRSSIPPAASTCSGSPPIDRPVTSSGVTRLAAAPPAIEPDHVAQAMGRIRGHVRETPIIEVRAGELGFDHAVTLKLELLQHAGSFKPRGAF